MSVLVASTIVAHKLDGTELSWLTHIDAMRESTPDTVDVFLAVEVDRRGLEPFGGMIERLKELDACVAKFSLDFLTDAGDTFEITTGNRYIRICTGRNLAIEYAIQNGHSHILYLDTDTEPTPDCIPRLTELGKPLVFGHVPTYNLDGDPVSDLPGDTRRHWSSAGFCMVGRDAFRRVRWGWDPDDGKTDDPCFARDVELMGRALGKDWAPVTRHDVVGRHHPESILPLEQRGTDRTMYR